MWAIIELDDIYVNICVCVWLDWVDTCQWLLLIFLFFFLQGEVWWDDEKGDAIDMLLTFSEIDLV